MSEPQVSDPNAYPVGGDMPPELRQAVVDRTHELSQGIIDARLSRAPFPAELVLRIVGDSKAEGTLEALCFYMARYYDDLARMFFEATGRA